MLKWSLSEFMKTSTLRPVHYGNWFNNDSSVLTRVGQVNLGRRVGKISGRPRIGWADDWDRTGKHYSKLARRSIQGRIHYDTDPPNRAPKPHQERKFKYDPGIPWDDNPASWDDATEFMIELEV